MTKIEKDHKIRDISRILRGAGITDFYVDIARQKVFICGDQTPALLAILENCDRQLDEMHQVLQKKHNEAYQLQLKLQEKR